MCTDASYVFSQARDIWRDVAVHTCLHWWWARDGWMVNGVADRWWMGVGHVVVIDG